MQYIYLFKIITQHYWKAEPLNQLYVTFDVIPYNSIISGAGITEPAVRYVCRVLMLTLHRYRDSTSQSYVNSLLTYLASSHREWTLRSLLPVLLEVSEQLRNTATSWVMLLLL